MNWAGVVVTAPSSPPEPFFESKRRATAASASAYSVAKASSTVPARDAAQRVATSSASCSGVVRSRFDFLPVFSFGSSPISSTPTKAAAAPFHLQRVLRATP